MFSTNVFQTSYGNVLLQLKAASACPKNLQLYNGMCWNQWPAQLSLQCVLKGPFGWNWNSPSPTVWHRSAETVSPTPTWTVCCCLGMVWSDTLKHRGSFRVSTSSRLQHCSREEKRKTTMRTKGQHWAKEELRACNKILFFPLKPKTSRFQC